MFVPLKCTCIPLVLHVLLKLLPYSLYIWNHYGDVLVVVVSSVWCIVHEFGFLVVVAFAFKFVL